MSTTQKIEANIRQGLNFIPQARTADSDQIVVVYVVIGLVGIIFLSCILFMLTKSSHPSGEDPLDNLSDEDEKKERQPLINNEAENDDEETALTEN